MAGDEPIHRHNQKPDPPRQSRPGELLFEFHVARTHTFYRVELRDHGEFGVEAQVLDPVDPIICRTFRASDDPTCLPSLSSNDGGGIEVVTELMRVAVRPSDNLNV